jgi:hypothetical protein
MFGSTCASLRFLRGGVALSALLVLLPPIDGATVSDSVSRRDWSGISSWPEMAAPHGHSSCRRRKSGVVPQRNRCVECSAREVRRSFLAPICALHLRPSSRARIARYAEARRVRRGASVRASPPDPLWPRRPVHPEQQHGNHGSEPCLGTHTLNALTSADFGNRNVTHSRFSTCSIEFLRRWRADQFSSSGQTERA